MRLVPAAPSVDGLIARLEAATAGSCELDDAIFDCLHPPRITKGLVLPEGFGDEPPANFGRWTPEYTTSLDAALTLVPEGAVWHVMTDYGGLNRAKIGPAGRPSASIYHPRKRDELFIQADAATPALALCIAALKTRQAVPQTGPVSDRTAPNTESSPNNNVSAPPAGKPLGEIK